MSKDSTPKVSVVIVAYQSPQLLKNCLSSLQTVSLKSAKYEVIVVDNSPTPELKKIISASFPRVTYYYPGRNLGYGAGNNFGAQKAKGEYLFFLNPDTTLSPDTLQQLYSFASQTPKAGIIAPTLFDMNGTRYPEQGSTTLTPVTALAAHSIIHALWPNNPIARWHLYKSTDHSIAVQKDVVPGTALFVPKKVFESVNRFDPKFFLYFEECDLCRRVMRAGWQIWHIPQAKVQHVWEGTTAGQSTVKYFKQSRYRYFLKYYGSAVAWLMHILLELRLERPPR